MSESIRAVWYDLADDRRESHLEWLHGTYLPAALQRPGISWAASYEITGGGDKLYKTGHTFSRPEEGEVGQGTDYLLLMGAGSPHVFFHPIYEDVDAADPETAARLGERLGERVVVFIEEVRVNGPEYDYKAPATVTGPAIQMGSFQIDTLANEFDLAAWYAQYRLPAMTRMPGCIATRKLVSVAGWAKHSVLYEFTSLDQREAHFGSHESQGLDEKVWTNKIIHYTIHAPGSPSVGRRLWPAAESN